MEGKESGSGGYILQDTQVQLLGEVHIFGQSFSPSLFYSVYSFVYPSHFLDMYIYHSVREHGIQMLIWEEPSSKPWR